MFIGGTVNAQHDFDINAAGLFYKNFGVDYEYNIKDQMGIGLSFTYAQNTLGMALDDGVNFSTIDIVGEHKFYPNPSNGGDRFYISLYIKYRTSSWKDMSYTSANLEKKYDMSFQGMAVGFQTGYKKVFPSGIYFEGSIGAGRYLFTKWDDTADPSHNLSDKNNDYKNNEFVDHFMFNWDVRFALSLGWRFGKF